MKKIEYYKCEICGRTYDNEKDASRCEGLHVPYEELELVGVGYESSCAFPSEIVVKDKRTTIMHTYYRQ